MHTIIVLEMAGLHSSFAENCVTPNQSEEPVCLSVIPLNEIGILWIKATISVYEPVTKNGLP